MKSSDQPILMDAYLKDFNAIAVRSDTRHPVKDGIFEFGFHRRGGQWPIYGGDRIEVMYGPRPDDAILEKGTIYLYHKDNKIMVVGFDVNGDLVDQDITKDLQADGEKILKVLQSKNHLALPQSFQESIYKAVGDQFRQPVHKIEEATFRDSAQDIAPTSAICLTLEKDCAPIFPEANENTWLYFVKVGKAYSTYSKQTEINSVLQFAKEIAMRDVASGEIIGAIKCKRYWNGSIIGADDWQSGMYYQLIGNVIWNPKLANEVPTVENEARKKEIQDFVSARHGLFVECPIPQDAKEITQSKDGSFKKISPEEQSLRENLKDNIRNTIAQLNFKFQQFGNLNQQKDKALPLEIINLMVSLDKLLDLRERLYGSENRRIKLPTYLDQNKFLFRSDRLNSSFLLLIKSARDNNFKIAEVFQLFYYLNQLEQRYGSKLTGNAKAYFVNMATNYLHASHANQTIADLKGVFTAFINMVEKPNEKKIEKSEYDEKSRAAPQSSHGKLEDSATATHQVESNNNSPELTNQSRPSSLTTSAKESNTQTNDVTNVLEVLTSALKKYSIPTTTDFSLTSGFYHGSTMNNISFRLKESLFKAFNEILTSDEDHDFTALKNRRIIIESSISQLDPKQYNTKLINFDEMKGVLKDMLLRPTLATELKKS